MANLINAKCPNCGAILELPEKLDRAFCHFCGGKVIVGKDEVHYHGDEIHYHIEKRVVASPELSQLLESNQMNLKVLKGRRNILIFFFAIFTFIFVVALMGIPIMILSVALWGSADAIDLGFYMLCFFVAFLIFILLNMKRIELNKNIKKIQDNIAVIQDKLKS